MTIDLAHFLRTAKAKMAAGKPFLRAVDETAKELYPSDPSGASKEALDEVSRLLNVSPFMAFMLGQQAIDSALAQLDKSGDAASKRESMYRDNDNNRREVAQNGQASSDFGDEEERSVEIPNGEYSGGEFNTQAERTRQFPTSQSGQTADAFTAQGLIIPGNGSPAKNSPLFPEGGIGRFVGLAILVGLICLLVMFLSWVF